MVREQKMCERQWCLKHVLCVPVGIERQMSTRTKDQQHTVRTDTSACIRKKETHRPSISTPTFFRLLFVTVVCPCCLWYCCGVGVFFVGAAFVFLSLFPLSLPCLSLALSLSPTLCPVIVFCSFSFLVCIDTYTEAIDKNTKMYT